MNFIYQITFTFFFYSFFGWIYDIIGEYIGHKRLVNRGFFMGPYCPIYGFGMLAIILLINPNETLPTIFLGTMVVATFLEYITSFIMEKLFHAKWWDYSDKKYNINGRISLQTSIYFGLFATVIIKYIQPLVYKLIDLIPKKVGYIILSILVIGLTIDFIFTIISAFKLKAKSKHLIELFEKKKEDFTFEYKKKFNYVQKHFIKAFPKLKYKKSEKIFKNNKVRRE